MMHSIELIAYRSDGGSNRFFRWAFSGSAAIAAIVAVSTVPEAMRRLSVVRCELRCTCGKAWDCSDPAEIAAVAMLHMVAPGMSLPAVR
jgi:hypothetical protein